MWSQLPSHEKMQLSHPDKNHAVRTSFCMYTQYILPIMDDLWEETVCRTGFIDVPHCILTRHFGDGTDMPISVNLYTCIFE